MHKNKSFETLVLYCHRNNIEKDINTLSLVEIKKTCRACFGGWLYTTWLIVDDQRVKIANCWEENDYILKMAMEKYGIKFVNMQTINNNVYICDKIIFPIKKQKKS